MIRYPITRTPPRRPVRFTARAQRGQGGPGAGSDAV